MTLIDSHVHLDFAAFDPDRTAVMARARAAGVGAMVVPGVVAADWPRVSQLAQDTNGVFACYGLHPCFIEQHSEADIASLADWVDRASPVAIGECGLDFFGDFKNSEMQQRYYLEAQLDLAREKQLPVVLHARRAVDDVLKMVRASGVDSGVLHSYSGSLQQANKAIELGLKIGIGGSITHARANKARAVAAALPLSSVVLETDAPDQPGAAHRGARNEPAYLLEVAQALADCRGESLDRVVDVSSANAHELFSLAR